MTRLTWFSAFVFACSIGSIHGSVLTAEEYAHSLEARFLVGESSESIRRDFETNGVFNAYDVLPYCYRFEPNTNNLAASLSMFEKKVAFLKCIYSRDERFMPQSFFDNVFSPFETKISNLRRTLFSYVAFHADEPGAKELGNQMRLTWLSYVRYVSGFLNARKMFGDPRQFANAFLHDNTSFHNRFRELANFQAYGFSFDDLTAELSTNRNVMANENFRHAITEDVCFATDNLLAAERNIRRKNNVLKIITLSCMFKTNEQNRSLSYTYCSSLTNLYAHYEERSPESLNLTIEDKTNLMHQLREAIEIYTIDNPFCQGNSGENPR